MATASSEVSNNDESTSSHPSTAKSNASSEKTRNPQSPHPEAELINTVVAEHGRLLILDPAEFMVGECFNRSEETYDSDSFDQLVLSILKNQVSFFGIKEPAVFGI
jgi:hypothetical protein